MKRKSIIVLILSITAAIALAAEEEKQNNDEKLQFWPAFVNSLSMIIATEIGDKTFFIAAVLSMKNDRFAVFSGAYIALICMTVLSTLMGLVLPSLLPRKYTHILSGILFVYFGVKLVMDSLKMEHKVSDELEEVEEELCLNGKKQDVESLEVNGTNNGFLAYFVQSLTLTFLAEWGDRSQIATIALSSSKDPLGVTIGGCIGHGVCTGMACLGGRFLATRISEKSVSFYGGLIFLLFGFHALFFQS